MMWDYWIALFTETHCVARGLRPRSIAAYKATLQGFRAYARLRMGDPTPDSISACNVLSYVQYLRDERKNGASAVNRQVTIVKNFYRAIVAMGHLEPRANPMANFPKIKAPPRKLAEILSEEEIHRLIASPDTDTVLGLRDRAMLVLLYGTGMRASECSGLDDADFDFETRTVRVRGKGGRERVLPLQAEVVQALLQYSQVRGKADARRGFFQSRNGKRLSRGAIYERVRVQGRRARLGKKVSPHRVRHSFATHLIRAGAGLQEVRELLGHRLITSTQIYLHMTAEDLRKACERHPISRLIEKVADLLPNMKLPFQRVNLRRSG